MLNFAKIEEVWQLPFLKLFDCLDCFSSVKSILKILCFSDFTLTSMIYVNKKQHLKVKLFVSFLLILDLAMQIDQYQNVHQYRLPHKCSAEVGCER